MYCDECKDQAHAEKEELIRQRDVAYTALDLTTKCNCPSPCNAQGCLLRELQFARLQVRELTEKTCVLNGWLKDSVDKEDKLLLQLEAVKAAEGIAVEQHNLAAAEARNLKLQNNEYRTALESIFNENAAMHGCMSCQSYEKAMAALAEKPKSEKRIHEDGHEIDVMTQAAFNALPEYSCTLPTGQTIGKKWKCDKNFGKRTPTVGSDWVTAEYVDHPDATRIGIKWRRPQIRG